MTCPIVHHSVATWASWDLFHYPIRRLVVISRKVSKPRDLYNSSIFYLCSSACQISKRCDDLNYEYRRFKISRDLTIRRIFRYSKRGPGRSQIIEKSTDCSTTYSVLQGNTKAPYDWYFVRGIHWWLLNSPHKWPVMRKAALCHVPCVWTFRCLSYKPWYPHNNCVGDTIVYH